MHFAHPLHYMQTVELSPSMRRFLSAALFQRGREEKIVKRFSQWKWCQSSMWIDGCFGYESHLTKEEEEEEKQWHSCASAKYGVDWEIERSYLFFSAYLQRHGRPGRLCWCQMSWGEGPAWFEFQLPGWELSASHSAAVQEKFNQSARFRLSTRE